MRSNKGLRKVFKVGKKHRKIVKERGGKRERTNRGVEGTHN